MLRVNYPADATDQKMTAILSTPIGAAPAPTNIASTATSGQASVEPHTQKKSYTRLWGVGLAVILVVAICYFLVPNLYEVETDDAYVEAHLISVIPKVPAYVKVLHVDDNSKVKRGDLLLELDPRDYSVQVDLAQANVEAARARLEEAKTQIGIAQSSLRQAQAEVSVAQAAALLSELNLKRLRSVSDIRGVATERIDSAKASFDSTHALVTSALARREAVAAQVTLAAAQRKTAQASLSQSDAQLAQAQLNLSYTRIYAAESGSIANKSVEQGNYVEPGQRLLSVVPETSFVVANYKETQLTRVKPGQYVEIGVDAFPHLRLRGHVDSIQRGTGSRFALLPPENATGNFVKVVQRVPVKIIVDGPREALQQIAPGMSVETKVFISKRPAWLGLLP